VSKQMTFFAEGKKKDRLGREKEGRERLTDDGEALDEDLLGLHPACDDGEDQGDGDRKSLRHERNNDSHVS